MKAYPLRYHLERPPTYSRVQLLVRLLAFCVLGMLGTSFGSLFALGYLALPVFAAIRLASRDPALYAREDGPRILTGLRWLAAVAAWTALVAETLPAREPSETLSLELDGFTHPTPTTAMWRLIRGIPSALVLAVLGAIGVLVWLWAALTILVDRRVGARAFWYLSGLQRWSIRLLAYQASLVDEYPPFSLDEVGPITTPLHATGR